MPGRPGLFPSFPCCGGGPSSRTPWLCLPLVCPVSRADRSGTLVAHGEGVQDLRRGDVTPGIDGLLFPGNLGTGTRGTRGKGHDHLRRRRRPATTARAGVRACASAATEGRRNRNREGRSRSGPRQHLGLGFSFLRWPGTPRLPTAATSPSQRCDGRLDLRRPARRRRRARASRCHAQLAVTRSR